MLKRVITSLVSICVLLPVLFFSDTVVLPAAISIVCSIALYEMCKCIGKSRNLYLCLPVYAYSVASPFVLRYLPDKYIAISFIVAALYLLYAFAWCVLSKGTAKFYELGEFFAVSLYILASFNAILYIRDLPIGRYIYLLIFAGAWITDIFAYFCGVLFGKHKLVPEVSPKKTVEGSIGGIAFCILAFVLFGVIINLIDSNTYINYIFLVFGAIIISVVSQIGDLIMSVIKRQYGVKDYGKIFPGHGGVLDRFDSILAVALVMCVLCVFSEVSGVTMIGGGF